MLARSFDAWPDSVTLGKSLWGTRDADNLFLRINCLTRESKPKEYFIFMPFCHPITVLLLTPHNDRHSLESHTDYGWAALASSLSRSIDGSSWTCSGLQFHSFLSSQNWYNWPVSPRCQLSNPFGVCTEQIMTSPFWQNPITLFLLGCSTPNWTGYA